MLWLAAGASAAPPLGTTPRRRSASRFAGPARPGRLGGGRLAVPPGRPAAPVPGRARRGRRPPGRRLLPDHDRLTGTAEGRDRLVPRPDRRRAHVEAGPLVD